MKTTVKKLSETKVVLTIVVDRTELEAAEQVALKKMSRDVKVPGFRKGHVPLSVVAKNINPNALQEETLDNALAYLSSQGLDADAEILAFAAENLVDTTGFAGSIQPLDLGYFI